MKRECHIVGDLLPLYLENMVSEESAALIEEHFRVCESCCKEYESLKKNVEAISKKNTVEDIRPFKKLMKKINRQTAMLSYGLIVLFIFFGFSLTADADMMYNSLIMPVVGIFGYIVFRKSAFLKMPVLLLVVDSLAWTLGMSEMPFSEVLFWTVIYYCVSVVGTLSAMLLHYAFRKENKDEE